MEEARKNQIWNELIQVVKEQSEPQRPDEISVTQFIDLMKENGVKISRDKAREVLDERVEKGELIKRYRGRGIAALYRPAK